MKKYEEKERYDINDLKNIMKILRAKDGCPWDSVQTHKSIRKDMFEEALEVMEAIDADDPAMMREELGDVLLQTVFHSSIEEDKGNFTFDDVVDEVSKKLIIRHPFVFGDETAKNIDEAFSKWDSVKKETKNQKSFTDTLRAVAETFPPLMKAQKLGKRAMRAGMDFANVKETVGKVYSEYEEIKEAVAECDREHIKEEIGDILFALTSVARKTDLDANEAFDKAKVRNRKRKTKDIVYVNDAFSNLKRSIEKLELAVNSGIKAEIEKELGEVAVAVRKLSLVVGIDDEEALYSSCDKFINRFAACEEYILSQGKKMSDLDSKELDRIWEQVKEKLKK